MQATNIYFYFPTSQKLDAYGIKRFDMTFCVDNDELLGEHLEVHFLLQLDEKAKLAKVHVVAQKKVSPFCSHSTGLNNIEFVDTYRA